ncbi:MAG TPA: FliM/FliN family flagellar motor C-terminal domain-containing protein [Rhodanobacter sp.]
MELRLLRWQSSARAETCREYIASLLASWCADWFIQTQEDMRVERLLDGDEVPNGQEVQWWLVKAGTNRLHLAVSASEMQLMGRRMLAMEASRSQANGLFATTSQKAVIDLLRRLCGMETEAAMEAEELSGAPEEAVLAARHGALGFEFGSPFTGARLYVNAGWCDRVAPVKQNTRSGLTGRTSAISGAKVRVEAKVALGELSLHDTLDWQVGEVLVMDAPGVTVASLSCGDRLLGAGRLLTERGVFMVKMDKIEMAGNSGSGKSANG